MIQTTGTDERHRQAAAASPIGRRVCLARLGAGALAAVAPAWSTAHAASPGPRADEGFHLSADFDPVGAVWLGFAPGHDEITVGLAAGLAPHVKLKYLLREADDAERLQELLRRGGVKLERVEFMVDPAAGYFMRDHAVFAAAPDGRIGVVDFRATLYGTAEWCRKRYGGGDAAGAACIAEGDRIAAGRNKVDRALARHLGAAVFDAGLAMEGGGIEVNGRGVLIANEELWASRNPGLGRMSIERALLALPGLRKVIWLPAGLAEDVHLRGTIVGDHVAWGAGGHTDEFVRFADERTVLLAWPDDADAAAHPVSRLTRRRMERNLEILSACSDARGRRLRVVKVPMPRLVQREVTLSDDADGSWSEQWTPAWFPARERRVAGQRLWQVATASYLNFVVVNEVLLLPDYLPHGTPPAHQERVRALFESVFPGRKVSFVDTITANWVGGGLHCATINEPGLSG
jgi:agmatine deiminase